MVTELPTEYSSDLNRCMMSCLRKRPEDRVDARALLNDVLRGKQVFKDAKASGDKSE